MFFRLSRDDLRTIKSASSVLQPLVTQVVLVRLDSDNHSLDQRVKVARDFVPLNHKSPLSTPEINPAYLYRYSFERSAREQYCITNMAPTLLHSIGIDGLVLL